MILGITDRSTDVEDGAVTRTWYSEEEVVVCGSMGLPTVVDEGEVLGTDIMNR